MSNIAPLLKRKRIHLDSQLIQQEMGKNIPLICMGYLSLNPPLRKRCVMPMNDVQESVS